jgi:hypothetical protein
VIVIDYSQIAISNIMFELKGKSFDAEANTSLLRHMILNSLRSIRTKFFAQYGELVIACDNRSYWRKEVFPNYKASRKKTRSSSTIDWEKLFKVLNQIKEELSLHFPYPVIDVQRAEADDVIAALAEWTYLQNQLAGGVLDNEAEEKFFTTEERVLIVSGDNDFLQLQKYPHVDQYNPVQKKMVTLETGQTPALYKLQHIIGGDTGDGIPNVLSPDDVFITEGTRQASMTAPKLAAWMARTFEENRSDPIYGKNFIRNETLVDFDAIPEDVKAKIVESFKMQSGTRNRAHLFEYFQQHRMKNLLGYLTQF